jgi:hypothetical protein
MIHSLAPRAALAAVIGVTLALLGCGPEGTPADETGRSRSQAIAPDVFGINVAGDAPGGAAVATLGARWARLELRDGTEGPDLSGEAVARIGAQLADYHAHGVSVLLVLDYTTREGFGGGGVGFCPPQGDWYGWRDDLVARAGHAAALWGDAVDAWQIWNEPDHPCGAAAGYEPYVDPHELGWLAQDMYAAIRASSSTPVVLAGLESGDPGYMDEMVAATGGWLGDYADGIAIQIYGVVPNDDWCVPGGPAEGEFLNCAWGRHGGKVHQYYERSGGLPVWVTEVGLRSEDPAKMADYLEDAYVAFASAGDRLERVFWFAYSDAMVPPFGLTDASWQPKHFVYERYQMLAGVSGGGDPGSSGGPSGGEPAGPSSGAGGGDPSCGDLGAQNGWSEAYCEWNGNGACNGEGPATWDCDHCCAPPPPPAPDPSCGDLAAQNGWSWSLCEWNGNGACGGSGTPTWDCDFCCPGP